MSVLDPTASAALDAQVVKPVFFMFLDFVGKPVRANTSGADLPVSGSSYPEMNGHTFLGVSADFLDVTPVSYAPGGSKSVSATLSGIPEVDEDSLEILDNPENWRGRNAMIWRLIRNASNVQQGAIYRYYTGKMTRISHRGSSQEQSITVTIESYLAALSEPSNRTYLDQERYDPGDFTARASIAVANGNISGSLNGSSGGGSIFDNLIGYRNGLLGNLM